MNKPNFQTQTELKSYKLFIFDWDGTLMDSQDRIVSCLHQCQIKMNLAIKTQAEYKNIIGLGLNEAIAQLNPELSTLEIEQFADIYRQSYLSKSHQPLKLFEFVEPMLNELKASGAMLAIATGKARRGLNLALQESGLEHMFHASRCADETFSKPNPQMLIELLDEFALEPQDAIMIGDTEYDLMMAKTINMDSLAVSYGVHEKERLLACEPLDCVDNVEQLATFLQPLARDFLA